MRWLSLNACSSGLRLADGESDANNVKEDMSVLKAPSQRTDGQQCDMDCCIDGPQMAYSFVGPQSNFDHGVGGATTSLSGPLQPANGQKMAHHELAGQGNPSCK